MTPLVDAKRKPFRETCTFVDFGSIPLELCERFNSQMSSADICQEAAGWLMNC